MLGYMGLTRHVLGRHCGSRLGERGTGMVGIWSGTWNLDMGHTWRQISEDQLSRRSEEEEAAVTGIVLVAAATAGLFSGWSTSASSWEPDVICLVSSECCYPPGLFRRLVGAKNEYWSRWCPAQPQVPLVFGLVQHPLCLIIHGLESEKNSV